MSEIQMSKVGEPGLTQDERTWGMLSHLSAALLGFLGPLIIWLAKRGDSRFIDDQSKESLNFQITIFAGMMISMLLVMSVIGAILGSFLAFALWILDYVFIVLASIKSYNGQRYRYPCTWRPIK